MGNNNIICKTDSLAESSWILLLYMVTDIIRYYYTASTTRFLYVREEYYKIILIMCICIIMPRRAVTVGCGEDDGDGGDRSRVAGLAGAPLTSRCRFDRRRHCCPHGPDKVPRLMGYLFLFIRFCSKKPNRTVRGRPTALRLSYQYNITMIIMRSTVSIPTAILV